MIQTGTRIYKFNWTKYVFNRQARNLGGGGGGVGQAHT